MLMSSSNKISSLEESGKLLEQNDREELKGWVDSLYKKYRAEEVSKRLNLKVSFHQSLPHQRLTMTLQPSIPTEAVMMAVTKNSVAKSESQISWSIHPADDANLSLARACPSS